MLEDTDYCEGHHSLGSGPGLYKKAMNEPVIETANNIHSWFLLQVSASVSALNSFNDGVQTVR